MTNGHRRRYRVRAIRRKSPHRSCSSGHCEGARHHLRPRSRHRSGRRTTAHGQHRAEKCDLASTVAIARAGKTAGRQRPSAPRRSRRCSRAELAHAIAKAPRERRSINRPGQSAAGPSMRLRRETCPVGAGMRERMPRPVHSAPQRLHEDFGAAGVRPAAALDRRAAPAPLPLQVGGFHVRPALPRRARDAFGVSACRPSRPGPPTGSR